MTNKKMQVWDAVKTAPIFNCDLYLEATIKRIDWKHYSKKLESWEML